MPMDHCLSIYLEAGDLKWSSNKHPLAVPRDTTSPHRQETRNQAARHTEPSSIGQRDISRRLITSLKWRTAVRTTPTTGCHPSVRRWVTACHCACTTGRARDRQRHGGRRDATYKSEDIQKIGSTQIQTDRRLNPDPAIRLLSATNIHRR